MTHFVSFDSKEISALIFSGHNLFLSTDFKDFLLVFAVLHIPSERSGHDYKEFILLEIAKFLCETDVF